MKTQCAALLVAGGLLNCIIVDLPTPEFKVDSDLPGAGSDPSVAMASDGRFVVVWTGYDGDDLGVFGRRYAADGNPAGDSFQVSTNVTGWQGSASVAMTPDGGFVVVWVSPAPGPLVYTVFGRQYNADGSTAGFDFLVSTYAGGDQLGPSVATACDGAFVVAWEREGGDGDGSGVFGRRYTPEGDPVWPEFQVNTYTPDDQISPSVAMTCDGRFAAVWASNEQDGERLGVYGQRFAADGNPVGTEFRVNTNTVDWQGSPSAAMADDGRLMVVWVSWEHDRHGSHVYGQRYAADGSTVGTEFRVDTPYYGSVDTPSVAMTPDGRSVVAWTGSGRDGDEEGILCRRFDADGTAAGSDFVVNIFTNERQMLPSAAVADDGSFVVVWTSRTQWEPRFSGIFAQLYDNEGVRVVP